MTRTRPQRRRSAFTLIEMLVVMAALGVALAFGTALIVTTQKTAVMGEATSDRLAVRAELARQFRADVARAGAAPDRLGDVAAGPDCLILKMPGGATVVYRKKAAALERVERTGTQETTRLVPLGRVETAAVFVRPTGGAGVVTLRVTEPAGHAAGRVSDLSAALGGDLR